MLVFFSLYLPPNRYLVSGGGFEPPLTGSEPAVLPLNYPESGVEARERPNCCVVVGMTKKMLSNFELLVLLTTTFVKIAGTEVFVTPVLTVLLASFSYYCHDQFPFRSRIVI
jgi:hypothetical protein